MVYVAHFARGCQGYKPVSLSVAVHSGVQWVIVSVAIFGCHARVSVAKLIAGPLRGVRDAVRMKCCESTSNN